MYDLKERRGISPVMTICEDFPFPSSKRELDPDRISYEIMRFPDADVMTRELAKQILASDQQFDAVIYPLRGGLYPGTKIAQALICPAYPIGLRLYKGIQAKDEARKQEVEIYRPLPADVSFEGMNVLAIDDVNHTSSSLEALEKHLGEVHRVGSITIGVLHEKPAFAGMQADYVVRKTDSWIVYPWEHLGDGLHAKWEFFAEKFPVWMLRDDGQAINWSGCLARSRQIGFREEELPKFNGENFYSRLYAGLQMHSQELREGKMLSLQEFGQMLH